MDSSSSSLASPPAEVVDGAPMAAGAEDGGPGKQVQRCQSWLPTKRRFCAAHAMPGMQFCGNHKPSAAETRVPCPVDPSHTVLQGEVANHIRKCPTARQLDLFENQAYFCRGINAGSDDDADEVHLGDRLTDIGGRADYIKSQRLEDGTKSIKGSPSGEKKMSEEKTSIDKHLSSALKRAAVSSLSGPDFRNLVARIEDAFRESCGEEIEESIMQPQSCRKWLDGERDRRLPFQEKHALQQASLLGNLEVYGLLDSLHAGKVTTSRHNTSDEHNPCKHVVKRRAIVELGAGRGYLSHMLCDCYNVHKVVMVERRSYKFKADRTIRQSKDMILERLRLDIENLNLNEVRDLQNCHVVAISKHLCGPATDLSLRCCLRGWDTAPPDNSSKVSKNGQRDGQAKPVVDGLGIATCCHHVCQWKSYVNKRFFMNLGFTKDDFHAITWFTSWALSGNEEHGTADCDSPMLPIRDPSSEEKPEVMPPKAMLSEAMNAMDAAERVSLGRKCKRLIDMGRLFWLREKGMQAKLVEYIAASVSPENKLLLARCV